MAKQKMAPEESKRLSELRSRINAISKALCWEIENPGDLSWALGDISRELAGIRAELAAL